MIFPMFSNIQCVLHDTLLALLAGQWHFAVRLASNCLHGRRRAGCATDQTGALGDRCSRLCARGGDVGGIGDTESLEGGGRSRCGIVSLLVAVEWRGGQNIPRSAMAVACLVVENMATIVIVGVLRVEEWRVVARGRGGVEVVSMIRV